MIRRVLKWGTLAGLIMLVAASAYFMYLYRQVRDHAERDEGECGERWKSDHGVAFSQGREPAQIAWSGVSVQ